MQLRAYGPAARLGGAAFGAILAILSAAGASAGTLDTIRQTGTVRLAYREDAPPFSSKTGDAEPAGYSVELCRAVVASLKDQLSIPNLAVKYVSVTAANRFDAIRKGQADLLCEATTQTLDRRKTLDFSIPTFISGASVIIQVGGPTNLEEMAGKKIAVLTGTTTEQALLTSLKEGAIQADVIPVTTHQQGMELVENGKVAAYFAERVILQYLQRASKSGAKLQLSNYLTYEPYALALPYGDEEFRLAVDTALSDLFRSGAITAVFTRSFGPEAAPSQIVRDLFIISALPE